MKRVSGTASAFAGIFLIVASGRAQDSSGDRREIAPGPERRTVAITIDDLPAVRSRELAAMQALTEKLIARLAKNGIQVVGFVNEAKLAVAGEESQRADLLESWLVAGHDLGNHTYSHPWLYETPLEEFEADVIRGEAVTSELLARRGRRLRYFRHPRLNTGPDIETKEAFEKFLAERGYTIAPVTVDNDEYVYALAYYNASVDADSVLMTRIGDDYVRYMAEVFEFYETLSRGTLGREVAQILLIHANRLNADYLDRLVEMLRDRGYGFVTLDTALKDPAYATPDDYVGRMGLSWLMRWAITMGKEPGEQPEVPGWVLRVAWPQ
jgi:peptidoglycan/xylan/chitin deacetylase (PgdA/CDA1 family)